MHARDRHQRAVVGPRRLILVVEAAEMNALACVMYLCWIAAAHLPVHLPFSNLLDTPRNLECPREARPEVPCVVVFDLETTGLGLETTVLNKDRDRTVEITAVNLS